VKLVLAKAMLVQSGSGTKPAEQVVSFLVSEDVVVDLI
jgi:hypothetical protein